MFGGASWALHRRQEAAQHHSCDAGATAMCSRWETGHRGEFHSGLLVGPLPLCLLTTTTKRQEQQQEQRTSATSATNQQHHCCHRHRWPWVLLEPHCQPWRSGVPNDTPRCSRVVPGCLASDLLSPNDTTMAAEWGEALTHRFSVEAWPWGRRAPPNVTPRCRRMARVAFFRTLAPSGTPMAAGGRDPRPQHRRSRRSPV